jgi:hypothetical protein
MFGRNAFRVLFFAAVFAFAIRRLARNYFKSLLARGWPTLQGRVEFGRVEERSYRFFNYYVAKIGYCYSVNNESHSGYFERVFFREKSAEGFVTAMKGQVVFVRSNPERPEHSAMLKQDQPGGWAA